MQAHQFMRKMFGDILWGYTSTALSLPTMQSLLILSPLLGDEIKCKGYVAIPPTCGPPRRQG